MSAGGNPGFGNPGFGTPQFGKRGMQAAAPAIAPAVAPAAKRSLPGYAQLLGAAGAPQREADALNGASVPTSFPAITGAGLALVPVQFAVMFLLLDVSGPADLLRGWPTIVNTLGNASSMAGMLVAALLAVTVYEAAKQALLAHLVLKLMGRKGLRDYAVGGLLLGGLALVATLGWEHQRLDAATAVTSFLNAGLAPFAYRLFAGIRHAG